MPATLLGPEVLESEPLAGELGAAVASHGYGHEALRELIGDDGLNLRFADVPVYLKRLDDSPRSTLVKLFYLETPAAPEEAERAGVPEPLLRPEGDGVSAAIRLDVYEGLVFAADRYRTAEDGRLPREHVTGVNLSSLILAGVTLRRPVGTALDLGTGCGIQTLLAAGHADRVTASDVNPRALAFTAFNARLNGVKNVELVRGSYFEPLEGRRFDLIVTNPPFVISPDHELTFRDSGLPGDTVSREIVRAAPDHLEEGGVAHVMVSWILREDAPWWTPIEEWADGCGCDAWALLYKTEDAIESASSWAKAFHGNDLADFRSAVDRWLAYYRELGLAGIATGMVTLRRRAGRNWLRADEFPDGSPAVETDAVLRLFACEDLLAELDSLDELLERRLRTVAAHRLDRTLRLQAGDYATEKTMLWLEEGMRSSVQVDSHTVRLLAFCDGERPLREFVAELSADLGMTFERTAEEALPVARRLLELGFLVPS